MKKKEHYGKLLQTEIDEKGYSKRKICQTLHIGFRRLECRLADGDFTISQLEKLIDNRYLPK